MTEALSMELPAFTFNPTSSSSSSQYWMKNNNTKGKQKQKECLIPSPATSIPAFLCSNEKENIYSYNPLNNNHEAEEETRSVLENNSNDSTVFVQVDLGNGLEEEEDKEEAEEEDKIHSSSEVKVKERPSSGGSFTSSSNNKTKKKRKSSKRRRSSASSAAATSSSMKPSQEQQQQQKEFAFVLPTFHEDDDMLLIQPIDYQSSSSSSSSQKATNYFDGHPFASFASNYLSSHGASGAGTGGAMPHSPIKAPSISPFRDINFHLPQKIRNYLNQHGSTGSCNNNNNNCEQENAAEQQQQQQGQQEDRDSTYHQKSQDHRRKLMEFTHSRPYPARLNKQHKYPSYQDNLRTQHESSSSSSSSSARSKFSKSTSFSASSSSASSFAIQDMRPAEQMLRKSVSLSSVGRRWHSAYNQCAFLVPEVPNEVQVWVHNFFLKHPMSKHQLREEREKQFLHQV